MSILDGVEPSFTSEIEEWLYDLYIELSGAFGVKCELYLFNFFEECRIKKADLGKFARTALTKWRAGNEGLSSFKNTIIDEQLLHLLEANSPKIPQQGYCYRSFQHLVYAGFIENSLDEPPPKVITLKKPFGTGTWHLWVTFILDIDCRGFDADMLRDQLGLEITSGDYLYRFPVNLLRPKYIPTVFDAFGRPPFRPVLSSTDWGLTRNLNDDKVRFPEILILPFKTVGESPHGVRVDPKISSTPPNGWIASRLNEASRNKKYQQWRRQWLR
jgi:hypothetical protein